MAWRAVRPVGLALGRGMGQIEIKRIAPSLARTVYTSPSLSVSIKKAKKKLTNKEWVKILEPEQYYVCREAGTETPFSGVYCLHDEEGTYSCVCCKNPLFSSKHKYSSRSGWPAFADVLSEDGKPSVMTRSDSSHGMIRVEVLCRQCDSHLGHLFDDGPQPHGLHYCINSVALSFEPTEPE